MSATIAPTAGLGESLRRLIATGALSATTIEVGRRDVVYSCLDGDRSVYVVERGQLKAVVASREGKDCLMGIHSAGDVFGESCLFGGDRMETVTAMTPTVLKRIHAGRVVAALADSGVREDFVRYFAQRLSEQQQLITDLVTADSEYRLAAILLHLGRKLGKRDAATNLLRIEERITQEELSGMVGTTRSRVGYFLKRFHHAGLVARTHDCFLVLDERRLDAFLIDGYRSVAPKPVPPRPVPSKGPAARPHRMPARALA